MTFRLLGLFFAALLGACANLPPPAPLPPPPAPGAAASSCEATARSAPADPRIRVAVAQARLQHQSFGAQTIAPDGGMFRLGHHEAGWSRPAGEALPAWQRVATFWSAVAPSASPGVSTSAGRVAIPEEWLAPAPPADVSATQDVAVREALLRVAMMDTPWSAAFISYLMKEAGFTAAEFAFSDRHVAYVRAALEASAAEAAGAAPRHAFRACDIATTRPRVGDLLCATRASTAGIVRFDALAAAVAARDPALGFPMHCDLVVHADAGQGSGIEVIGGNVLNSVTLSRMALDGKGVLSQAYVAGAAPGAACPEETCRPHLSRRPWVVLLQFRR